MTRNQYDIKCSRYVNYNMKNLCSVAKFQSIPLYILKFIATRLFLDLCEKANRRPGTRVARRWWQKTGIDWKGSRERAEAAAEAAEPGTKVLADSESEADDATDGTVRGTGEEASLGPSGSSGAEWSGRRTNYFNSIGRVTKAGTTRNNFKPKRDRVQCPKQPLFWVRIPPTNNEYAMRPRIPDQQTYIYPEVMLFPSLHWKYTNYKCSIFPAIPSLLFNLGYIQEGFSSI